VRIKVTRKIKGKKISAGEVSIIEECIKLSIAAAAKQLWSDFCIVFDSLSEKPKLGKYV
jgi:hypothetical protein